MKLYVLLASLIPMAPTNVQVFLGECGAAPALPKVTELLPVQVGGEWVLYVTAWEPAPAPECWQLGRTPLLPYTNGADTPLVHEPQPWIEGLDFPCGAACPTDVGCRKVAALCQTP